MATCISQIRDLLGKGLSTPEIALEMATRGYGNTASLHTLINRARNQLGLVVPNETAGYVRVPVSGLPYDMLQVEAQERDIDMRCLCLLLLCQIGHDPDLIDAILDDPRLRRKPLALRRRRQRTPAHICEAA